MVPWEVGTDPRLKHLDTRIYFVLAGCRRGSTAKLGTRLIAKYACTSQRRAIESLKRLESLGYVDTGDAVERKRRTYELTAQHFNGKRKPAIGAGLEHVDGESTTRRRSGLIRRGELTPTMVRCPRCSKHCGGLLKAGYCRGCRWNDKVDGRIEAKLKTA